MLEEKTTKKQNFLAGAAVLSLATMIVKVIGMFFKIPLNRLIGEANYGYFTTAYDIYTVLLMISTTGLPVAMSRMISEARALNNGKQVRQIYRVSLMAFLSIGIIGSALMLIIPKQLANMMENPNAMWSIFALGPAVLFVCYISACRGFFQGQGNMAPTAVSQIIEALCKLFLGLGLAWLVMNRLGDGPLAAAGSIAGVTIGTISEAKTILDDLIVNGYVSGRVSLGLTVSEIPETYRRFWGLPSGVVIESVTAGSNAYYAGLHAGDVICQLGDSAVTNLNDYRSILSACHVGEELRVYIYRDGRQYYTDVTLTGKGESPSEIATEQMQNETE